MLNKEKNVWRAGMSALLVIAGILVFSVMPAAADLTVEPITWNIIGLDSSNVNIGPNQFPVGVRVHNTGTTNATNVVAAFVWDSTNTNINLYPSTPATATIGTIVGGSYKDAFFTVEVTRNAAAYDTARQYHINVTATGLPAVSTLTPRELYVERLTSESLNSEVAFTLDGAIIPPGGAINLMVDPNVTHTIVLTGATYPQGYGQLEQFITLPGGVFSITSVSTTYTVETSPYVTTPYKPYADACGWENDPNDPNYRSCVGGYYDYRAGGTVTTTLKFKVLKLPVSPLPNPVNISPLIYNFFNESYQYNSDYNASARVAYITDPAQIQISKNFVPDNISSGGISTLTFIITNPTDNIISGVYLKDTFPTGIVVATSPNVEIYGCGTSWTFTGGVSGSSAVWITNATIAAHGTGTIKVDVTGTVPSGQIQTFTNTTDPLYINGTTNTGLTASNDLTVGNTTNTCVSVPIIAQWQVPSHATNPPDKQVGTTAGCPTFQHSSASTATADAGIPSQTTIAGTGSGDGHSWEIWATGSAGNYVEFNIDTRNYSQIKMSFAAKRQDNNSAMKLKIYYNNGFGAQQNGDDLSITNDKDWHTHAGVNQLDFTGKTSASGITTFRIQPVGSDNDSSICFDNITFSGVTCTPPPRFTKYFEPDSILVTNPGSPDVSRLSLLTFIISNNQTVPNASQALQNVYFRDLLPGVLQIYNNPGDPDHQPVTCDGSTLTAVHLQQEITFSKPTMSPGEICTAKVYVMGTVADNILHINTTDPITCTGIPPDNRNRASAGITVRDLTPGISILKQLSSTGLDGSWRSYVAVPAGGNVYYKYTVENTGDVPLTDITITDPPGGTVIYSWGATSLPVGGSVNYVSLPIAASLGTHVNTAQASGTYSGTPYTDTSSATYATAELAIVKIAEADHYSQEGEVLHYTYTVANTGYAPLEGPVTIIDDIAESESCQDLTAIGDRDNFLDVGEHVTCTATYTVQADDVGDPIVNNAYATADGITSDSVQATVDYLDYEADVEVVKTCEGLVPGNQQLVYVITVTNNGPNPAEDVVLEDDFTDPFTDGLSSIQYSVDGGTRVSLPDGGDHQLSLSLGDMSLAETHSVKIYANVPAGFLSSNTASVTSATSDPVLANNSSTCASVETVAKQRALEFPPADTSSYNVTVGDDDSLDLGAAGTLEAWIYPQTAFVPDAGVVLKGSSANGICYGFGFGGGSGGTSVFAGGAAANIGFVIENTAGARYLLTATRESLKLNHWYHVACVWNAAKEVKMIIYINGLVEAARIIDIGGGARMNTDDLVFGTRDILTPAVNFRGVMDEVRVWSTDRTRIQIRDYMCKKLTGTEANLVGYWRFDEESGPCMDTSPNGNNGATNATRICSEAPMGDASLWDYTGIYPEDFTRNLTSPNGDYITVTGDGGTWSVPLRSGLQVYRVDGPPTPASAPIGQKSFKSAPHYWGVFMTGGTDPTYKIVYNYLGYPGITNEDTIELDYRNHNCENWKDSHATLDTEEDTLTRTGLSGTEFILGSEQDPRNTIQFDGSDDNVVVTDISGLRLTNYGSLEAWIYVTAYKTNAGVICKGSTTDGYLLSTDSTTGDNIVFSLYESSGPSNDSITSATILNTNTWYHVAATWDGANMNLYINGVLDSNSKASAQVSGGATGINLTIGTYGTNFFQGLIDEVRVWDVARSQARIRDTMCKKITNSESDFGRLMGYWRFDEETGDLTCPDYSGSSNDGTMSGFGAADSVAVRDARCCSSAPIGDDSAYDYYDGVAGSSVSAQLAAESPDTDYMFATEYSGDWGTAFSGLHIYRVDESPVYPPDLWDFTPYSYRTPNGLTPPAGWSSIDYYRYWGVFVTDWDGATHQPNYDLFYYYSGNPSVPANADGTPGNPEIGLARRPEYCYGTWEDPGSPEENWNLALSRLELFDQAQYGSPPTNPEYVLGGINQPLAITLASFTAEVIDGCIEISWETATEISTLGFELWRSTERNGTYELVSGSYTRSAAVMESMGAIYSFTDCDIMLDGKTVYYYKLEEIDLDNIKDNPLYGPIGPAPDTVTSSQPTAAKDSRDKACFIRIIGL